MPVSWQLSGSLAEGCSHGVGLGVTVIAGSGRPWAAGRGPRSESRLQDRGGPGKTSNLNFQVLSAESDREPDFNTVT